jgi:hypothetical protein
VVNRGAAEAGLAMLDDGRDFADGVIAHEGRALAALCGRPRKWQALLRCQSTSCSATDQRRQSRPKPFGSWTAWSSST